jgi:ribosomal-protein-alanine N-acetyltransferase
MDDVHFPELFTNRLVLRALETSDWEEILFLRSDKEVNQFIKRPPERQTTNKR